MRIEFLSKHHLKICYRKEKEARKKLAIKLKSLEDEHMSEIIVLQQAFRRIIDEEIEKKDQVISSLKDKNFKLRDTISILKYELKKMKAKKIKPLGLDAEKSDFELAGMPQKKAENVVTGSQLHSDSIIEDTHVTRVRSMINFFNGISNSPSSSCLSSNALNSMGVKNWAGEASGGAVRMRSSQLDKYMSTQSPTSPPLRAIKV